MVALYEFRGIMRFRLRCNCDQRELARDVEKETIARDERHCIRRTKWSYCKRIRDWFFAFVIFYWFLLHVLRIIRYRRIGDQIVCLYAWVCLCAYVFVCSCRRLYRLGAVVIDMDAMNQVQLRLDNHRGREVYVECDSHKISRVTSVGRMRLYSDLCRANDLGRNMI